MTHRIRWPLWLVTVLVAALAARWWWPSSEDAVVAAPALPVASAPTLAVAPDPRPMIADAKPLDTAPPASTLALVGTVIAADRADSFALVRRTADSQLVKLRAGDRVEGLTVSAIGSASIALAGAGQAIVIEADATVTPPATSRSVGPARAIGQPAASDVEPAWAGDPAPFGH